MRLFKYQLFLCLFLSFSSQAQFTITNFPKGTRTAGITSYYSQTIQHARNGSFFLYTQNLDSIVYLSVNHKKRMLRIIKKSPQYIYTDGVFTVTIIASDISKKNQDEEYGTGTIIVNQKNGKRKKIVFFSTGDA